MRNQSAQKNGLERSSTDATATNFTLVALGASAGGIHALQSFFQNIPPDSGMAFVVIMHLSPTHESNLAQVIQASSAIPVNQVVGSTNVEPNHIYVISPAKHLVLEDNVIELVDPQQTVGRRLAVDLFFRTLAATYGSRAVAVVLSGSDSDGAIGIKHIKEQGGITIAQDPAEAEFDSMPRSAINTGMVDWVLPAAQIALQLLEFRVNEKRMHVPPDESLSESDLQTEDRNSGGPLTIRTIPSRTDEQALLDVLQLVRTQTGHDFKQYKRATLLRRVARRMQVNLLENIPSYLDFVRMHPSEVSALVHDLLISVTNFFRDASAFEALESQLPLLFADKSSRSQIRVWVAGCATGEEAYSVSMLLAEYAGRLEFPPSFQVFATDLDEGAIQAARKGAYAATIEADVSAERLRRFFRKEEGRYLIRKELRERVLFSVHNLLTDPPFSRVSLVTCRNLLIYLKPEAQASVLDVFHFALQAGGLLLLGSAENIPVEHGQFAPLAQPFRLFVRRTSHVSSWKLPISGTSSSGAHLPPTQPALPAGPSEVMTDAAELTVIHPPERAITSYGDLHLNLLEQFAPPSLVVNAQYDIVHLSEHCLRYLQISGEPSLNLLKVVNTDLRTELRTALFRASHQHTSVSTPPLLVNTDSGRSRITLHVRPTIGAVNEVFYLVVFEALTNAASGQSVPPVISNTSATLLEDEIEHLQDQMRATVEQYEASVEELKAANEEHQSMNEELRCTAEELETSKEELQSTNEELTTVNQELTSHMEELSNINADLQNLMASTEIGTIFLDKQLCIKRFTPRIRDLFNIIPTDIGRPLSDITHKLNYLHFEEDAEQVLESLVRTEREVQSEGRTFLARLLPYRTLEDRIDGIVLTFVEITDRVTAEERLRESEEKYHALFASMDEGYCILEMLYDSEAKPIDWRYLEVNPAFEKHNGLHNATGKTIRELAPNIEAKWLQIYGRVAQTGKSIRFQESAESLGGRDFDAYAFRVGSPEAHKVAVLFTNITERKLNERQKEFLARLNDTLRSHAAAADIQSGVSESVMQYFGADRCYYCEVDGDKAIIRQDAAKPGMKSVAGEYLLADYPLFAALNRYPTPITVPDTNHTKLLDASLRTLCIPMQITAFINIPLIKGGVSVANLCIAQNVMRNWTDSDVELAQEIAERTWMAVERAHAEQAMRESESRLRALIGNLPGAAVFILNQELKFVVAEGEAILNAGLSSLDYINKTIWEAFPSQFADSFANLSRKGLQGEAFTFEYDLEGRSYLSRGAPLLNSDGVAGALLIVSHDISDRKRIEAELQTSEERYRQTVENLRDYAIFTLDQEGRITSWSEGAFQVKGYSADEVIGKHFSIFSTQQDRQAGTPQQEFSEVVASGRSETEGWRVRKDGSLFWANEIITAVALSEQNALMFVKISRDMSERREAEQERMALEQDATRREERNRMAQELHDTLAQGFTGIKLQMDAAEAELDDNREASRKHISRARQLAQESLSDARRSIQALRSPLLEGSSLKEALQSLAERADDGIEVAFECMGTERPISPELENDLYRISQEAFTNALRHAIASSIVIEMAFTSDSLRLRIADNGIGFDPAARRSGFGRIGMEERVLRSKGNLQIITSPGNGTEVIVTVNLPD